MMALQLKIIGILLVLLATVHGIFPKYFNWKKELASLSLVNRQMMQVHTVFISLTLLLMGLLCWSSPGDLTSTPLGKRLCLGMAVFWGLRWIIQFVGYSKELWRGKTFETGVHILFSLLWGYLTITFVYIWWN